MKKQLLRELRQPMILLILKSILTPATHRFLEKEGEIVRDKEQLFTKTDQTFVAVHPKFYIPSDGTTCMGFWLCEVKTWKPTVIWGWLG